MLLLSIQMNALNSTISLVSKFNGSIVNDYPNSPENSEFYLEIDSQNSLMSKQKSTQTLES